jgi:hypothetical protein
MSNTDVKSSADLTAIDILSKYIHKDSAVILIPQLCPNTIERIIAQETGFDFSKLMGFFENCSEEIRIEYLKLADKNPKLANEQPYVLGRQALESSAEIQRLRRNYMLNSD